MAKSSRGGLVERGPFPFPRIGLYYVMMLREGAAQMVITEPDSLSVAFAKFITHHLPPICMRIGDFLLEEIPNG